MMASVPIINIIRNRHHHMRQRSFMTLAALAATAIVLAGCTPSQTPTPTPTTAPAPDTTAGFSAGAKVGPNAIYAADQKPGTQLTVGMVSLEAAGYVVIHADNEGKPGPILGQSALLSSGVSNNVTVTLPQTVANGVQLHAMPHRDDGDGIFDAAKDAPIKDTLGNVISMMFAIDAQAAEAPPVQF
ncbi:MAG: Uncharacterized protein G01um101431_246 [Parcubacteria group bacterium Gr01-1014_31]|nr:MAG: Uncharacterized protein G01um101431_246 [Parcubacteria group bacterium Gr01-1014_31]